MSKPLPKARAWLPVDQFSQTRRSVGAGRYPATDQLTEPASDQQWRSHQCKQRMLAQVDGELHRRVDARRS